MKRILVTGAGGAASANFVKSLRLAPEEMYIVGTDAKRYHLEISPVDKAYLVPAVSAPDYLETLNRIVEREGIEFVHAQPDVEVLFLSENRHRVAATTFLPRPETIRLCQNKMEVAQRLAQKGVPAGRSFAVADVESLQQALGVLLAAADRVWLRAIKGAGARASLPVRTLEQARAWIDYWAQERGTGYGEFMATEFLPGREFAFQSLWRQGELVTSQARERVEYLFGYLTPSGQTSTPSVARTVHRDDVNEIATRAVLAIDEQASGIFCLDLKENREGVPCVTEVNAGRFFTTCNFFAEAGCNMPYHYLKLAYGESLPPLPKYNPLPADWYWVRMADMGHKLIKGNAWRSITI